MRLTNWRCARRMVSISPSLISSVYWSASSIRMDGGWSECRGAGLFGLLFSKAYDRSIQKSRNAGKLAQSLCLLPPGQIC